MSAIRRVLGFQERYNDTEPEDEWFGKRLWVLPGEKVASGSEGVLAVEDVYMERPMGYHVRDGGQGISEQVWRNPEKRKKIFNYCPELSMIMDMKLERERCPEDDRQGNLAPTREEIAAKEEETRKKAADETLKKQKEEDKKKQEALTKAAKIKEEEDKKRKEEEEKKKKNEKADNKKDDDKKDDKKEEEKQ